MRFTDGDPSGGACPTGALTTGAPLTGAPLIGGPRAGRDLFRGARSLARRAALGAGLLVALALFGCAGGGGYAGPETDSTSGHPAPPPPPPAADPNHPAGNPGGTIAPDAEIYTVSDRLNITDFRIDFAKMRNVLALVGVYPDRWEQFVNIPLDRIRELQFRGGIDTDTFERIKKGREDIQLNQNEIFRVTVSEVDGNSYEFLAIIPRVRGFRDGQAWNLSMAGGAGFDRIVFRPKR